MFSQKCFCFIFLSIKRQIPSNCISCVDWELNLLALSFWSSELFQEVIPPYLKWKRFIWEGICYENWQVLYMRLNLCLIHSLFLKLSLDSCYHVPTLLSNLYMRWQCLCTAECAFSSRYSTVASVEIDLCATQNIPSPGKRGIDFFFTVLKPKTHLRNDSCLFHEH